MASFQPNQLQEAFRDGKKYILEDFFKSEPIHQFYTFCERICLHFIDESEDLFKKVLSRAFKNKKSDLSNLQNWLYENFHMEWIKFSKKNPRIQASTIPLRYDWTHLDIRQGDDALLALTPQEREIFLYRFFLKYSTFQIQKITKSSEKEVQNLFRKGLNKLIKV